MDLTHICYDDRFRSKVLFSNTTNRAYELKVKVLDLKFGFKVLTSHIFPGDSGYEYQSKKFILSQLFGQVYFLYSECLVSFYYYRIMCYRNSCNYCKQCRP